MKVLKLVFSRVVIVTTLIFLQLFVLIATIMNLSNYFVYVYGFFLFISILTMIWLFTDESNPSVNVPWMILILLFPLLGGLLYFLLGYRKKDHKKIEQLMSEKLKSKNIGFNQTELLELDLLRQSYYIYEEAQMNSYVDSSSEYLASGEKYFERLLDELKQAKEFIFIETFILEEGILWKKILDVLVEKVKQGIEVRVMYDDFGCALKLPTKYHLQLEALGIKTVVFNPFKPIVSIIHNYRDHRKICVIDGWVGFTGGVNIADEYINEITKFGHWKDSGICIKGNAVWNLTKMFLENWNLYRKEDKSYLPFIPDDKTTNTYEYGNLGGVIQPFGDTPFDHELVSESVYLNIIHNTTQYLYITTPYFIVDNELVFSLCLLAKNGVDVRMITPHIPDKWYVHWVTQSYYATLLKAGIKIYEYTDGFIHSKTFVSDDRVSVVGTINMDYRSLYHHYECGIWFANTPTVLDVKQDFLVTVGKSKQITIEDCKQTPIWKRFIRRILRIFSPLL